MRGGRLTQMVKMMIANEKMACSVRDRNGYLPAHTASRSGCAREILELLLEANPAALTARTLDGETLLSLARSEDLRAFLIQQQQLLVEAEAEETNGEE